MMATLAADPLTLQEPGAPARSAYVLRIVDGRLAGKEFALDDGQRVCIGHALANDVVLRGSGTRNTVVELRVQDGVASLRVLGGSAELLGRTLAEGEEAQLPGYLPFRIGEFVLAHGASGSDRWDGAAQVAASPCLTPVAPLPAPKLSDRLVRIGRERLAAFEGRFDMPRIAIVAISVVLLGGAALTLGQSITAHRTEPANFEDRLRAENFPGLNVTRNAAGGLIVSGVVAGEPQMKRLQELVADAGVPVALDVTPTAALAAAATEVLEAQGVPGRVEPAPGNARGVVVAAPFLPQDRQRDLRELLQRDVPGLATVTFRIDDSRGGNPLQAFFGTGATGIATLVENPAHIVTADGTRWFPGAVLPTGHRLVSVGADSVRLEKDGRMEDVHL
jgi:type III secretion system YscD/HrpQ family protein